MPDVQITLNELLMNTTQSLGDYRASEAIARRSMLRAEQRYVRDSEMRGRLSNALANNLIDSGRFDEAADLLHEALRIFALRFGVDSLEVADLQNDLAAVEASRGRLQEAVRLRRQALQRFEHDPKAKPSEVDRIRSDLGVSLDRAGLWREAEAETHLQEAIAIRRREAADHPYLGLSLRNYALLLADTGRDAEAEAEAAQTIAEASAILHRQYGADSVTVVITEIQQALILARRSAADAASSAVAVRAALPRIKADTPLEQARGHQMLGQILLLQTGQAAEARRELASAVALFDQHEGAMHPEAAIASH